MYTLIRIGTANEEQMKMNCVLLKATRYSVKAICESLDVLPQTDAPHALDVLLSDCSQDLS